jgi:two-component system sensor histidine kinase/response regulator
LVLVAGKATEKEIAITLDVKPDVQRSLRGDPLRLSQILVNYLGNAIRFSNKSTIVLRVLSLESASESCLLRFEVQDSGIGLSPEEQAKVFDAFQQADVSTSRIYGGSGLGLAICKALAEAMGGQVGVQSISGFGSAFWFTARLLMLSEPVIDKPVGHESVLSDEDRRMLGQAVVLVVEDNELTQQLIDNLLSRMGVQVLLVSHGREALAVLESQAVDCVLMDLHMPEMDGYAATEQLRRDARFIDLPVIALTANAWSEVRARSLACGMNAFVSKPVNPDMLYAEIVRQIRGRYLVVQEEISPRKC